MSEINRERVIEAVRGVIGPERQIYLCAVADDSMGKMVTVRYEYVAQHQFTTLLNVSSEMMEIVRALCDLGLSDYEMRLFVVKEGINYAVVELRPPIEPGAFGWKQVGNRWQAELLPKSNFPQSLPDPKLTVIEEVAEVDREKWEKLIERFKRGFQKEYDEIQRRLYKGQYLPPEDE